jgi:hypothetical protein
MISTIRSPPSRDTLPFGISPKKIRSRLLQKRLNLGLPGVDFLSDVGWKSRDFALHSLKGENHLLGEGGDVARDLDETFSAVIVRIQLVPELRELGIHIHPPRLGHY